MHIIPYAIDLKGRLLKVATNLSPPYTFLEFDPKTNQSVLKGGFEAKLLSTLSQRFNFRYEVIDCNSNWGVHLNNGSWTGIVGALVNKEADIGFGGLTVTEERSEYVQFSHPHIITSVSFITPPPKSEPKIILFVEPFDGLVWICIILSLFLMAFTEYLIIKKWPQLRSVHIKWGILSALLKQTLCCSPPRIDSLRVVVCVWLMACLVLTASYGGCIYSLLAIPPRAQPINTVTKLADAQRNGQIQVTVIGGSSYYTQLKKSNTRDHSVIARFIKTVKNKKDGLDIVVKSAKPHSFISTRDHLLYGLLEFGSEFLYLPPASEESTLFLDIMAIALQKKFEFYDNFNSLISDVKKGGFLEFWRISEIRKQTALWRGSAVNVPVNSGLQEVLHLYHLQTCFYLFLIFQSLAILSLISELLFMRKLINH